MLLASLALSGLRPSAFGLSQVGFEITNKLWAHVRLFTGMLLLHIIEIQFSYMILDTCNGKARHAPVTINTKCNDLLRNTYGKLNFYWEVKNDLGSQGDINWWPFEPQYHTVHYDFFSLVGWTFLGLFLNFSWTFLELFLDFSWTFLELFLNFSWTFLKLFLGFLWEVSQLYQHFSSTLGFTGSNKTLLA